ncbi:MAG: radical SAM protein [Clostridia bacterium]|nr:radical SAM protein [Clostridia bacterium]
MKNIYMVQVSFAFDNSAVYLPYSVAAIASFCKNIPEIKAEYNFVKPIYKRHKIEDIVSSLDSPYMMGFSCYLWNTEFNKSLAKAVKEKYPECTIVFGGHNAAEDGSLLETEDYIDIVMTGEGEETFAALLREENRDNCPNIYYRKNGTIVKTAEKFYDDISHYPSPFLDGTLDEVIENDPDTEFLSVLETNRGCPYSCAYCDWCAKNSFRQFPMEKVNAEIKWLSDHKIEYIYCADANFGILDRDEEIIDTLISYKKTTGYPDVFRCCYTKNSNDRVFRMCKKLNEYGMDKGATLAYQSLSPEVLENIGRKNLSMEYFSDLLKKYNEAGIPSYSELILGLPGETKESFCKGLCTLLDYGQHNSISVYYCEVLPNSPLGKKEMLEKYNIEVAKVKFNHIHSANDAKEEVEEYSYIIRSTSTMSRNDWVDTNMFSVCLQAFHSLGLLRCFALYLRYEKNVSYYNFYSSLLDYIMNTDTGFLHSLFASFRDKYENSNDGEWNYYNEELGNIIWFFEEGAFIECIKNYEEYKKSITPFLKSFDIDNDIFEDIETYQDNILKQPFRTNYNFSCEYDMHSYFSALMQGEVRKPEKKKTFYSFRQDKTYESWHDFAKTTVWYGRRKGASTFMNETIKKNT